MGLSNSLSTVLSLGHYGHRRVVAIAMAQSFDASTAVGHISLITRFQLKCLPPIFWTKFVLSERYSSLNLFGEGKCNNNPQFYREFLFFFLQFCKGDQTTLQATQ